MILFTNNYLLFSAKNCEYISAWGFVKRGVWRRRCGKAGTNILQPTPIFAAIPAALNRQTVNEPFPGESMLENSAEVERLADSMPNSCELTILMPCLNEAETLQICITKAMGFLRRHNIDGEVLIADNGSTDGSQQIAVSNGARVVAVPVRGYGAALIAGIRAARGRYVIMGDSDDSYDFSNLIPFVDELRAGAELVMGNRFRGGIAKGAMPPLHRYLGNPVLTGIGRLFFRSPSGDFHCGLRGFNREAITGLKLRATGMEFASEMVVKATLQKLRIAEVPTTLSKDGRSRPPHLRSWRDGWRHLRFLLMFSPRWLFFYPGMALLLLGLIGMALLLPGSMQVGSIIFDVHTLLVSATAVTLGVLMNLFALLAKQFSINAKLVPPDPWLAWFRDKVTLEGMLIVGLLFFLTGAVGMVGAASFWSQQHFGILDYRSVMRLIIPSTTALVIGLQLVLYAFLSSIFDLPLDREYDR